MKFECQSSCGGRCCKPQWDGKAGFVFLTHNDLALISNFLKQPFSAFAQKARFDSTRFTKNKTTQWFLKDGEKQCRFLKEGKCSIYEVRPTQCRTFPFWPENMKKRAWKKISEFCPGLGKGEEQLGQNLLLEQIKADLELCDQDK